MNRNRRGRMARPALILLAALLLSNCQPPSARALMDHRFIFFPEKHLYATPEAVGLAFREVSFAAADGVRLHGWFVPGEPGRPVILFCHGNAGNISHRIDNLRLFRERLGVAVFIFDYRGYGKSEGHASEEGTYADARGALAWLRAQGRGAGETIYFGRSLGAAVAVHLAVEEPPAALVLESPFPSVAVMGRHHNPILYLLLGWALDARYDSLNKIGAIHSPLLLFQGEQDRIVPPEMARRLFARANKPKSFHLIPAAGHNDTYDRGGAAYWEVWRGFLDRHLPADTRLDSGAKRDRK